MAYEDQYPPLAFRTAIPVYPVNASGSFVGSSPTSAVAITPNNTTDIPGGAVQSFQVGVSGTIAVIFAGDTTSVTLAATAGVLYPYAVKRVLVTGTTATGIVGFRS